MIVPTVLTRNKYYFLYKRLYRKAKLRKDLGGGEVHHIIPLSLGGSNQTSNLVRFTLREHLIAHACLVRFLKGEALMKMQHALNLMCNYRHINSYIYESNRLKRISNMIGKKRTEETKQKMSNSALLRGDEYALNMSKSVSKRKKTNSHKEALSKAGKDVKKYKCLYCDKVMSKSHLGRWHNEKCPNKRKTI